MEIFNEIHDEFGRLDHVVQKLKSADQSIYFSYEKYFFEQSTKNVQVDNGKCDYFL